MADNHWHLPLHGTQHAPPSAALAATDGGVMELLLKQSYARLPSAADGGEPRWRALLTFAVVTKRAIALVDAGALLAGVGLDEAAAFVLVRSAPRRYFVVFCF